MMRCRDAGAAKKIGKCRKNKLHPLPAERNLANVSNAEALSAHNGQVVRTRIWELSAPFSSMSLLPTLVLISHRCFQEGGE